jgi:hypothetical protein
MCPCLLNPNTFLRFAFDDLLTISQQKKYQLI